MVRARFVAAAFSLLFAGYAEAASIQFFEGTPVAISGDGGTALVRELPTEYSRRIAEIRQRAFEDWQNGELVDISRLRIIPTEVRALRDQGLYHSGLIDLEAGTTRILKTLPTNAMPSDLSSDGETIVGKVGSWLTRAREPFSWNENDGVRFLDLPEGVLGYPSVDAVSSDGSLIVGTQGQGIFGLEAGGFGWRNASVIWRDGVLSEPLAGASVSSAAKALSANGEIIVGQAYLGGRMEAARWRGGEQPEVLVPSDQKSRYSMADAISGDGSRVFGRFYVEGDRRSRIFVLGEDDSFLDLGSLIEDRVEAELIASSLDGGVAVGSVGIVEKGGDWPVGYEAVLWRADSGAQVLSALLLSLGVDLKGVELIRAVDVSSDGQRILGETGDGRTFMAVIPEPSASILLILGLLGLSAAAGRAPRRH